MQPLHHIFGENAACSLISFLPLMVNLLDCIFYTWHIDICPIPHVLTIRHPQSLLDSMLSPYQFFFETCDYPDKWSIMKVMD